MPRKKNNNRKAVVAPDTDRAVVRYVSSEYRYRDADDNDTAYSNLIDIVAANDLRSFDLKDVSARAAFSQSLIDKGIREDVAREISAITPVPRAALSEPGRDEWVKSVTEVALAAFEKRDLVQGEVGAKPISLPEPGSGYPLFPGRRVADPVDWFGKYWAQYVAAGLDQPMLRLRDPKLMKALENGFVGAKADLNRLIPNRRATVTREVLELGLDPSDSAHRRAASIIAPRGRKRC